MAWILLLSPLLLRLEQKVLCARVELWVVNLTLVHPFLHSTLLLALSLFLL